MRRLADIARKYVGDTVRTTVEQNIVLRWVSEGDLPTLYEDLQSAGLAGAGAGTIRDVTACPGTDTCKLGIASSRGSLQNYGVICAMNLQPLIRPSKACGLRQAAVLIHVDSTMFLISDFMGSVERSTDTPSLTFRLF